MPRHVYRRPYFRPPRVRVPLTRGHGLLIGFSPRRRAMRRRAWVRRRLVLLVSTHGASAAPKILRRAARARRRLPRALRQLGLVAGRTATTSSTPLVRLKRLHRRPRRLIRARLPKLGTKAAPANNKIGPMIRFRRAVARIREAMQRRLRFRPKRPEVPEGLLTGEESVIKGRITQSGLVRGRITSGGM